MQMKNRQRSHQFVSNCIRRSPNSCCSSSVSNKNLGQHNGSRAGVISPSSLTSGRNASKSDSSGGESSESSGSSRHASAVAATLSPLASSASFFRRCLSTTFRYPCPPSAGNGSLQTGHCGKVAFRCKQMAAFFLYPETVILSDKVW